MPHLSMRKQYILRFVTRILVVAAVFLLFFLHPESFAVLEGYSFFQKFSPLHLLWLLWMFHMVQQLVPARRHLALGSQKNQRHFYQAGDNPNPTAFRAFIRRSNQGATRVMVIWLLFTAVIGGLYWMGIYDAATLLLFSATFYLCDLICVLFWCPFRVFLMKNRCCTTCRIFNWDHFMMFSPLVFFPGFFTYSLLLTSIVVLIVWEVCFYRHPERFWERSNRALRCSNCNDRLCGKKF